MDYLEVIDAHGRRRTIPLARPHLIIGREPTCDIHLPHPAVSRRHAQLQSTEQGRWLLQDLNSRNHVYLNNRRVQQIALEPGKQVRIAEYRLILQGTPAPFAPEPAGESQEETRDSWSALDRSWLVRLQTFQSGLLRLEEPHLVLERLASEIATIVHPQVLAIGLNQNGQFNWELVQNESESPTGNPLAEVNQRLTEEGSSIQVWDLHGPPRTSSAAESTLCLLFPMKGRCGNIGRVYLQRPCFSPLPEAIHHYLTLLAALAGLVWDNLQLAAGRIAQIEFEHELSRARQIQVELFPASFDVDPRLDVYGVNLPSAKVSGDLYDLIRIGPDTIAFVIADAMGHGMPAALLMAGVHAALHMGLSLGLSWKTVFTRLDAIITQSRVNAFVSGIVGQIDLAARQLHLVSAGHPTPSILVDGQPLPIPEPCQTRPWGLAFDVPWEVGQLSLGASWSILCYTDGILDAGVRTQRVIGGKRLAAYHQANLHLCAEDLCQGLLNEVGTLQGDTSLADDQTLLVLRSAP